MIGSSRRQILALLAGASAAAVGAACVSLPQPSMLQDQQRRALDQDQRKAALFQQQAILATDLPPLSLVYPPPILLYNNRQVFDHWYYTPGGIAGGQPTPDNKSVFVRRS